MTDTRGKRRVIALTASEDDIITQAAITSGLPVAVFVRAAAISAAIKIEGERHDKSNR